MLGLGAKKAETQVRHDGVKLALYAHMKKAAMTVECEAYGVFSSFVRQPDNDGDADGRRAAQRSRQALVPDFLYTPANGERVRLLMDVKTINMCETWYKGLQCDKDERGVDVKRRQAKVHADYQYKARKADKDHNGTQEGEIGPVARELETYPRVRGLVAGAFGEVSSDMEKLVQQIAAAAAAEWQQLGARDFTEARAVLIAKIRREIGIEMVRGYAVMKRDVLRRERGGGNHAQAARNRRAAQRRWEAWRDSYYQQYFVNVAARLRRADDGGR